MLPSGVRISRPDRSDRAIALVALLVCAGSATGCVTEDRAAVRFEELEPPAAPRFRHTFETDTAFHIAESIAWGVAVLDYDRDADLDVFAVDGAGRPGRLYRNDAGRFSVAPEGRGFDPLSYGTGVAAGDFDDDGRPDLYVTNLGGDALYRNRPGGFVDVTRDAGVANPDWGTSAAWLDYDGDGRLDMYVVNYLRLVPGVSCSDPAGAPEYCGPTAFPGVPDRLFRNLGGGRFADVSTQTGIGAVAGRGLGVAAADFDGDGHMDIYVANDGEPNFLWRNLGNGRFENVAAAAGAAVNGAGRPEAGMGVGLGDVDGDLRPDLFLTHLAGESNTLYRNRGDGTFADETAARGLHAASLPATGFGTAMADLDNDGDLDIVVANGRINRGPMAEGAPEGPLRSYAEANEIFVNDGTGHFSRAEDPAFGSRPGMSRGLAVADLDDDGGLDLLVAETGRELRVFRNVGDRGRWIGFRVVDPARGGRVAIGARVVVWPRGGRAQLRLVAPNVGYLSSHDPRIHVGLDDAAAVDSVLVTWPGGGTEVFTDLAVGRYHELRRGDGEAR